MKEDKINSLNFICNFILNHIYKAEIKENGVSNIDVNNIKFQKILYFLYGIYWKETQKKLFKADFKAWKFGPVIEEIYYKIQQLPNYNGYSPIPKDLFVTQEKGEINFDKSLVEKIINNLNSFSIWRLVEMSHMTDPWINTKQSELISSQTIKDYFNDDNIIFS